MARIQIDDLESAVAVSTGDLVRTKDRHSDRCTGAIAITKRPKFGSIQLNSMLTFDGSITATSESGSSS